MSGPSLLASIQVLLVGFVIAFLGSLLPQLGRFRKTPTRVIEESFFRSFTALSVMMPYWVGMKEKEPIQVCAIGLLVSLIGIKPSVILAFAAQAGISAIVEAVGKIQGKERSKSADENQEDGR